MTPSETPRPGAVSASAARPNGPRRLRVVALAVVLAVLLTVAGCSGSSGDGGRAGGDGAAASRSAGPATLSLTPPDGSRDVAPATAVVLTTDRGRLGDVTVRSAGGGVEGTLSADGRRWTSTGKLAFGSTYTVTASTESGSRTVGTFTTAPRPSAAASVRTSSTLGDGKVYGVAMPIILRLDRALDTRAERAAFEEALTVRSTPATTGAWGWVSSREVHFRPREFWAAGSTVHVEVDSAGRPLGERLWGRTDLTVDFRIAERREMRADAVTKRMQVVEGGTTVRTMLVSLGREKFPSSSGTMMVMEKQRTALFDSSTYGLAVDSPDGYRTRVQHALRLTWGGEFIHAAPWSVADQGRRNVSHGCINVSPADGAWLFARTRIGDPVVVSGTGRRLAAGNGWTDWDEGFAAWLQRSATGEQQTA